MPTALDIIMKIRSAYPDATAFREKDGEKVAFYSNGCMFILHPMPRGVRATIRRDGKQVFTGVVSSQKFDIDKFVNTLKALAAKAPSFGRKE